MQSSSSSHPKTSVSMPQQNYSQLRRHISSTPSPKYRISSLCRFCLLVPELDTLYVICYQHEVFMNFKRDLFVQLQQDVLKLIEEDLTPLMLLETMFKTKFVPLP